MITYLFPEPGSIPGIPGLFANCRVDVEDDGTYKISPLFAQPHNAPTEQATEQVETPAPIVEEA